MNTTDQETSGAHVWLVLMKAHRSLARHAERSLRVENIGLSDFVVLEMLLHKGPQKVNDIGRTISLTSGAITAAVDRAEERGHVARTFDAGDRRARIVTLTDVGETFIRRIYGRHADALERAAASLSAPERTTLVALLKKLGRSAAQQLDTESNEEG